MIQELLNNAARHAEAENIWLTLAIQAERIDLEVRDDGVGFNPSLDASVRAGHFGLIHLRERIALLKGTITIDSAIGRGTVVQIMLPVGLVEQTDGYGKTAAR